jgi:hypothetical protein
MARRKVALDPQSLQNIEKLAADHRSGSTWLALRACRILAAVRPTTNVPRSRYVRRSARWPVRSLPWRRSGTPAMSGSGTAQSKRRRASTAALTIHELDWIMLQAGADFEDGEVCRCA